MNPAYWMMIFLILFLVITAQHERQRVAACRRYRRKNRKEILAMEEMAKRFIGRECLIYTLNSQITGTIADVQDGALLLDNGKEQEIVNLEYVLRIRDYPKNKNGKKKSVIVD